MSNVWTLLSQVTAEIFPENVHTMFPVKVYLCRAPCVHEVCASKNRHSEVSLQGNGRGCLQLQASRSKTVLLHISGSPSTLSSPTPLPLSKKLSLCLNAASSTCNITPSTYICSLRLIIYARTLSRGGHDL